MLRDVRYAMRGLWQAKGWTAVVLVSLALGIGANASLFSVLNGLLLTTIPVRDPGAIVRLRWSGSNDVITEHSEWGRTPEDTNAAFSYPMFEELVHANHTLSDLIACAPLGRVNVVDQGHAEIARAFSSSGNYYRALGVTASLGRLIDIDDDRSAAPPVAVLGHRYWLSRFGGERDVIGKVIRVNDVPVTVIGVVSAEFTGIQEPLGEPPDIAVPLALDGRLRGGPTSPATPSGSGLTSGDQMMVSSNLTDPTNWWLEVVGRLRPGVTTTQVEANLGPVFQHTVHAEISDHLAALSADERSRSDRKESNVPRLRVESGGHGVYDADTDAVRAATMLTMVVGIVLLIVCANVANLLLARAATRRQEIAIRLSMGATRRRLIRQMLTESLLLATVGGALGGLLADGTQGLIPHVLGGGVFDSHVLFFVIAIVGVTTVAFGVAPALTETRVSLHATLKAHSRSVVGSRRLLSQGLLVVQVALAVVLLIGASLFLRTTRNLQHVDVGFDADHVLLFAVNPELNHYEWPRTLALFDDLLRTLPTVPGVRAAALSSPALLSGNENIGGVFIQGRTYRGEDHDRMHRVIVSPGFFATMGLPVVRGRGLTDADREDAPPVALINETAARLFFPDGQAIGRRFGPAAKNSGHFEIVGIVRDAKYNSLREPPPATMYVPYAQTKAAVVTFEVRTAGEPGAAVGSVRDVVRRIDPNLPMMSVSTQRERIEERFGSEHTFAMAYSLFGALALVLASIGLFGLMSYAVARRTSEIGIRMALGARPSTILSLVMTEAMRLALMGIGVGLVLAFAAGRFIRTYLFGLSPTDAVSIGGAVALMVAVTAIAAFLPARRASVVDPLVALRSE